MRKQIERVKNLLEGITIGTIKITEVKTNSTGVLLNVYDMGPGTWDIQYLSRFYKGVYDRITSELGPDVMTSVEIGDYIINGGVEDNKVNLFTPSNNVMPSFTRHQFVLPVVIKNIPAYIESDHFTLPISTPDHVERIVKSLVAQRNVPKKLNHMFDLLRKHTMEVKVSEKSKETITVSYEFPESAHLFFENQPNLNYKVKASVVFPNENDIISVHIMDCDDFKQKTSGTPANFSIRMIQIEFEKELLWAFERNIKSYKLALFNPLHYIHKLIRITGCDQLNRTENDR